MVKDDGVRVTDNGKVTEDDVKKNEVNKMR